MNRKQLAFSVLILVLVAALAGCNVVGSSSSAQAQAVPTLEQTASQPEATAVPNDSADVLAALEATLQQLYDQVNPSVVNIRVVQQLSGTDGLQIPGFGPALPQVPLRGQGSGFVWDADGHIVTNEHVVDGASQIRVTFYDGTTVAATLVGADASSDLAVVKVDVPAAQLRPIQLADSTQVKVGELCVAIGNPFGLNGTMTVGFVSAVGRSLPGQSYGTGPSYAIPDVIQTDAPINPGNSGGVLVDDGGQLIGVTSAIESTGGVNSGVGFAIPSSIVKKVVPALIETGHYDHPWLGLSGTTLTPDLAQAMGLPAEQRGALVISVVADGPSAKAGLRGSDRQATVEGEQVAVGGDVIVAIDGTAVKDFADLVAYLANSTAVGQVVTLTVLGQGQETSVQVTLGVRPSEAAETRQAQNQGQARAYLGIRGLTVTPEIAEAMGLAQDVQGVLVEHVVQGGPAEQAGLHGSDKAVTIDGQQVLVGGDVITALDGQPVTTMQGLLSLLAQAEPGQTVTLTLLRDGQSSNVDVTLAQYPNSAP